MGTGAIGIVDSGVGGLSIWREIVRLLPWENTIYVADKRYFPYGEKSNAQLRKRADRIVQFLIQKGCSLIVLACNSLSVSALPHLRNRYQIPFVGVEPAVKPAALASKTKEITVLVTTKTALSQRQRMLINTHAQGITVHLLSSPYLVEAVETGQINSPSTLIRLRMILNKKNIGKSDHLVLGCTHYPFLLSKIRQVTRGKIRIIEPSMAVARRVREIRRPKQEGSKQSGKHEFYTTKGRQQFLTVAQTLLGQLPSEVNLVNL
ncbi:MAG: glutamate racemase [Candidatus Chisholmbacteria bacterium RIFCSPHIGHO2_12_FULL_49_9]|uniref:Glutamate racemase n=1 Tax=Candidatus Chisholmbacteria bacterium RIFCSPHIGHO2_01_FULL_52_32 TaxID=1797591 RepID=A0A1G1VSR3_9BACT|nr:MAG: glutamate racemase [Candidatus Chisholmbacteria bacterium RIFCSPHIGHO2_12_FULL_49_9]OGY18443.1 MAG: glutamate racemase [Candidatus Chisholmbacteria bacterium RIFCSPHIGHO2_01_FULL_52_32]OGY20186.1 MAG: glutamate racemase [Candidatus Chisholmbacteria bacterium RIFCSPLOWO2_01_FULL_50_28]